MIVQTDIHSLKKSPFQSIVLLGLGLFFLSQFLLLNPTLLEENFAQIRTLAPQEVFTFFQSHTPSLSKEVPLSEVPSYSAKNFTSYSTVNNRPQWKLYADRAYYYESSQIVHGRNIIYESSHFKTTALESVYLEKENKILLYGKVFTQTTSGLEINSEYAEIYFEPESKIIIPKTYPVESTTLSKEKQNPTLTTLQSFGLEYLPQDEKLLLPEQVKVDIHSVNDPQQPSTQIISDQALLERKKQRVIFTPYSYRPLQNQFVNFTQGKLKGKSRILIAQLNSHDQLDHLEAQDTFSFVDSTDPQHITRGNSGRALFTESNHLLTLYDYPQVYQDGDTITGDKITIDRNHNSIEADQSNAYNRR